MSIFFVKSILQPDEPFLLEEPIVSRDFGKLPCEKDGVPGVSAAEGISMPEQSTAPTKPSFLYKDAMERYIDQKRSDGAWTTRTLPDHRGRLKGFLEIIGDQLMAVLDGVNRRFGRAALRFGAEGPAPGQADWHVRQDRRSPRMTTHWGSCRERGAGEIQNL